MSAFGGILGGALALTALQAVVSTSKATDNASALVTLATSAVNRIVDVRVPLIPDKRT